MSVSWMVCTSSRSLMSSMLARVLFAVGSAAKENFCECLPRESLAWPTIVKTAAWPRPRTTKYRENCHHGRITKPLSLSLKPSKRTTPAVHTRQKRFYSFFPFILFRAISFAKIRDHMSVHMNECVISFRLKLQTIEFINILLSKHISYLNLKKMWLYKHPQKKTTEGKLLPLFFFFLILFVPIGHFNYR